MQSVKYSPRFSFFVFRFSLFILSLSACLSCARGIRAQGTDVRAFVRQTFIHGVPYEQASRFTSADATVLLEMLGNAQERAFWPNVVVTLGVIGDERGVDPLIAFFNREVSGTLSSSEYSAKTSVLMSLGYLVNRSKNLKALTYLVDSLNPETWATRRLNWVSPYHPTEAERNQQLTAMAVMGLALSGHPIAREALVALQARLGAGAPERALVEEALRAHEVIAREGLAAYYKAAF
ncbi:MAG: hypothetical protein A3F84_01840 [Candidatus Handelsmanbacteria bacterium RIFCSPLOWO2_12_FULL_64_10]|uniref:Peptidase M48 domain-containing protein n=1 Tax=Handelsmanbacteria sp. (strain RIFCSPLOWO2_12_FULL_64_10) TaxID=1817868 RepID=A0A1F6CA40_HANXR|nr:MAG: hypothetical protein A3F84_01840 [Candidatus Handelsmanbacteria bacterium RIFCSPLOWO2_12_FULL_64_10]